nr:MAG TPA: hypothetical protein [Caudoviricetes sp.]
MINRLLSKALILSGVLLLGAGVIPLWVSMSLVIGGFAWMD